MNEIVDSFLEDLIKHFLNEKTLYKRENQQEAFKLKIKPIMGKSIKDAEFENIINLKDEDFKNEIKSRFNEFRKKRIDSIDENTNLNLEKRVFLQTIDFLWRSHLQYLEHLRQVVGLRGYAQKDPLEEFKREAFKLFEGLLNKIKIDFITFLNNLEIVNKEQDKKAEPIKNEKSEKLLPRKMKRNEPCFCDSGKKYKHCHGAL